MFVLILFHCSCTWYHPLWNSKSIFTENVLYINGKYYILLFLFSPYKVHLSLKRCPNKMSHHYHNFFIMLYSIFTLHLSESFDHQKVMLFNWKKYVEKLYCFVADKNKMIFILTIHWNSIGICTVYYIYY